MMQLDSSVEDGNSSLVEVSGEKTAFQKVRIYFFLVYSC